MRKAGKRSQREPSAASLGEIPEVRNLANPLDRTAPTEVLAAFVLSVCPLSEGTSGGEQCPLRRLFRPRTIIR